MAEQRAIVLSPQDGFLFELAPSEVFGRVRAEEINGEHSWTVRTSRVLAKPMRVLTRDRTGRWREWVVLTEDADHASGDSAMGEYYCVWSLQYDLSLTKVSRMPGTQTPVSAATALDAVLSGTSRWSRGTVTRSSYAGASMYEMSGWEAMAVLLDTWGGELDAEVTVGAQGVESRRVALLESLGSQTAKRRFDWGSDLVGIRRRVDDAPLACRIVPKGKGEQTESGGYGRKIGIADVNGGVEWLQNDDTAPICRVPDGAGGWEYPTAIVENPDIEDPAALKAWALSVLDEHTTPRVTYEADVMQLSQAGMDVRGIALGDATQCVDRGFCEEGLRVSGRVVRLEADELDESRSRVTLGRLGADLAGRISSLLSQLGALRGSSQANAAQLGYMSTAAYVAELVDRLNEGINATGGYSYLVEGEGLVTYDRAVSDPRVGAEATKVVQVKGGSVRIADTKKAAFAGIDDWDWKTVFVSGHVAAELVTAVNVVAGFIGNASQGSYWDLDNNDLQIASGATLGSRTVAQTQSAITSAATAASDAAKVATNYLKFTSGTGLDVGYSGTSAKTRITSSGVEVFDGNGASALFAGLSGSNSIVRVGKASGSGNVVMSSEGYIDIRNASTVMAHFGYASGKNNSGGYTVAPYYDIGVRKSNTTVGNYSVAEGNGCEASGYASHAEGYSTATEILAHSEGEGSVASGRASHAEGYNAKASAMRSHAEGSSTTASGDYSHAEGSSTTASGKASHAEGYDTTASGLYSHAEGYDTTASGDYSHAAGEGTIAAGSRQFVCGYKNVSNTSSIFIVGYGYGTQRGNILTLDYSGNLWIKGILTQNSDRRLKEHHAWLGEDAAAFVRRLRPALFTKDGERHVGFYAQDVADADPWNTATVTAEHTDESLDFDPLTLDYTALIAPLVAYAQALERRIDEQQATIDALAARIEALEAR